MRLAELDLTVFHVINGWAGNWLLDGVVKLEEENDLIKGGLFFAAFWFLWWRPGPDRNQRREVIAAVLIGVIAALVINRAVAAIVPFRVRPIYDAGVTVNPTSIPIAYNLENWNSFPSDAATYFLGLATGLAILARPLGLVLGVYAVLWICLPRIYMGVHYPSDILIGGLLGIATVVLTNNRLVRRHVAAPMIAGLYRRPEYFYPVMFLVSFEMAIMFRHVRLTAHGVAALMRNLGFSVSFHLVVLAGALLCAAGLAIIVLKRRAGAQR